MCAALATCPTPRALLMCAPVPACFPLRSEGAIRGGFPLLIMAEDIEQVRGCCFTCHMRLGGSAPAASGGVCQPGASLR